MFLIFGRQLSRLLPATATSQADPGSGGLYLVSSWRDIHRRMPWRCESCSDNVSRDLRTHSAPCGPKQHHSHDCLEEQTQSRRCFGYCVLGRSQLCHAIVWQIWGQEQWQPKDSAAGHGSDVHSPPCEPLAPVQCVYHWHDRAREADCSRQFAWGWSWTWTAICWGPHWADTW